METFKMGTFTINGNEALANNDYATCVEIYGSPFVYWFTHYFQFTKTGKGEK